MKLPPSILHVKIFITTFNILNKYRQATAGTSMKPVLIAVTLAFSLFLVSF